MARDIRAMAQTATTSSEAPSNSMTGMPNIPAIMDGLGLGSAAAVNAVATVTRITHPTEPGGATAERLDGSMGSAPLQIQSTEHWTGGDPNLHYRVLSPHRTAGNTKAPEGPEAHLLTIVFVHGMEHQAACWAPTATLLAARYGVTSVLIDLRGHGQSHWSYPVSRARFSDDIADVSCVLDAYRQLAQAAAWPHRASHAHADPRFLLVGHSKGGPIAVGVARRQRLVGLYLLATVLPADFLASVWRSLVSLFLRHLLFHPRRLLRVLTGCGCIFDGDDVIRRYLLGGEATDEQVETLRRQLEPESVRAIRGILVQGISDRLRLLVHRDFFRSACRAQHIRVAAAENDALMRPVAAAKTARLLCAEMQVLPGLPHDAMCARTSADELIGEALAADLAEFAARIACHLQEAGETGETGATQPKPC